MPSAFFGTAVGWPLRTAWAGVLGDRKHPFIWTKTADDILDGITVRGFNAGPPVRLRL